MLPDRAVERLVPRALRGRPAPREQPGQPGLDLPEQLALLEPVERLVQPEQVRLEPQAQSEQLEP